MIFILRSYCKSRISKDGPPACFEPSSVCWKTLRMHRGSVLRAMIVCKDRQSHRDRFCGPVSAISMFLLFMLFFLFFLFLKSQDSIFGSMGGGNWLRLSSPVGCQKSFPIRIIRIYQDRVTASCLTHRLGLHESRKKGKYACFCLRLRDELTQHVCFFGQKKVLGLYQA